MEKQVEITYPHNRTWQTRTTADGRSYQATKIDGKYYFQYTYGFSGGYKQALEHMGKYYPNARIIIEEFSSGLAIVLVEAD